MKYMKGRLKPLQYLVGLTALSFAYLTGCSTSPYPRTDDGPILNPPPDTPYHYYQPNGPTSDSQTAADRAYDPSDPNNPTLKKGKTPLTDPADQ
jgi:hypothetical protein